MSVAIGDDGRLLVHCFAGCSIGDVLGAMGLSVGDLFPARIRDTSTAGRREASEFARQAQWRAALNVLAFEATIIVIAARELREGKPLATDDDARLILACERVIDAKAVLS
ncbi:MAG: hypothetical protein IPO95_08790 [Rhodanobacteraceae bacterium]|nr:hypothetical protein [Rhodanobacteraceae bacterium]